MTTQALLGLDNKEVKKVTLKKEIFGAPVRRQLLWDYVQAYLINQRQGTVKTKTRGEVHGTTKKMYAQKGTGNARHGDAKANIFVGGGRAFGPRPRPWYHAMPQTAKKNALISALSLRQKEKNLILVQEVPAKEIRTKKMAEQLKKWGVEKGILVLDENHEKVWKSVRNIANVHVVTADSLNAYDILKFGKVVVTEKALEKLEKRLS